MQRLFDFRQAGAKLLRLDLQHAVAGLAGIALRVEFHQLLGQVAGSRASRCSFSAAADSICARKRLHARRNLGDQRLDALQASRGAAVPLFQRGHLRHVASEAFCAASSRRSRRLASCSCAAAAVLQFEPRFCFRRGSSACSCRQ